MSVETQLVAIEKRLESMEQHITAIGMHAAIDECAEYLVHEMALMAQRFAVPPCDLETVRAELRRLGFDRTGFADILHSRNLGVLQIIFGSEWERIKSKISELLGVPIYSNPHGGRAA